MKKIILSIFFFAAVLCSYAQSNKDLIQYYNQLKKAGYTDKQIELLARENGYDTAKGSSILNAQITSDAMVSEEGKMENATTNYSANSARVNTENIKMEIFGSRYFTDLNYNFSPQINIATPLDYQLGPGDELAINLWGASEASYQKVISREGRISIEGVGPIFLNGYTIFNAKEKIKRTLANIYKGLISDDPSQKVNIEISLLQSRSVFVSIIGQVNNPGLYTLNGLSTVIHGLYSAAGINQNGSYRSVELIRLGKVIAEIDLYSYFVEGKLSPLFLQDQDVIRVPYYSSRVSIEGQVKTTGLFELKQNESLSDLFRFSGGLTAKAVDSSYLVTRVENSKYITISTDSNDFKLKNGDHIEIYSISDQKENRVSISGEVIVPGNYSLASVSTVNQLIESAKGFTDNALKTKATIIRQNPLGESFAIPIALEGSLREVNNFELKNKDSLIIYSNQNFYQNDKIFIEGLVKSPGEKMYFSDMGVEDLISQGGGITQEEENLVITIKSKDQGSVDYVETLSAVPFDLNKLNNITLSAGDVVSVNNKNNITPLRIILQGEVLSPGVYVQTKSKSSLRSIINSAGGFTPFASLNAIYIERVSGQDQVKSIVNDSLINFSSSFNKEKIFIPVNNIDDPIFFENNDKVVIKSKENTVELLGNVIKPSIVPYSASSSKYYLKKVGLSSVGSKRHTLVIYPNKEVFAVKRNFIFNSYPKVVEGSQIIVGEKPERTKLTSQELITVTSGLSTLIIVLSTLLSPN